MHRFSGETNPEAPITHHWLDSTHITYGVATGGLVCRNFKLEGLSFTGREPDQYRYNIERPRFDSWSMRGTWNPTSDLSLQVSQGYLKSPEQLEPNVDQRRTTASATYNRPFLRGNWQTTFAWGRKVDLPGKTTDAYLLSRRSPWAGTPCSAGWKTSTRTNCSPTSPPAPSPAGRSTSRRSAPATPTPSPCANRSPSTWAAWSRDTPCRPRSTRLRRRPDIVRTVRPLQAALAIAAFVLVDMRY